MARPEEAVVVGVEGGRELNQVRARGPVEHRGGRELHQRSGGVGVLGLDRGEASASATVSLQPGLTCSVKELATALNGVEVGCGQCLYLLEWT